MGIFRGVKVEREERATIPFISIAQNQHQSATLASSAARLPVNA
jgi:hypothetical protein